MTAQSNRSGVEIRKGRGQWEHWAGTPSDLAEIARLAQELVGGAGSDARLTVSVGAPAFETTFSTPDQLKGLSNEDLNVLTELSIEVDQTPPESDPPRRVAVTISRPPPSSDSKKRSAVPVVRLAATGPDRDWVDLATLRMTERLNQGERATKKVNTAVLTVFASLLIGAFAALAFGDEKEGLNAGEIAAIALFSLAGVALILFASIPAITPQLELLPDEGATRWERLVGRFDITGRWLLDAIVKAAIGAGVVLLIGWLT